MRERATPFGALLMCLAICAAPALCADEVASALEAALEASGVPPGLAAVLSPDSAAALTEKLALAEPGEWERAAADAGLAVESHGDARFIVDPGVRTIHEAPPLTREPHGPLADTLTVLHSMPAPARIAAAQGAWVPLASMGAEGDAALKRLPKAPWAGPPEAPRETLYAALSVSAEYVLEDPLQPGQPIKRALLNPLFRRRVSKWLVRLPLGPDPALAACAHPAYLPDVSAPDVLGRLHSPELVAGGPHAPSAAVDAVASAMAERHGPGAPRVMRFSDLVAIPDGGAELGRAVAVDAALREWLLVLPESPDWVTLINQLAWVTGLDWRTVGDVLFLSQMSDPVTPPELGITSGSVSWSRLMSVVREMIVRQCEIDPDISLPPGDSEVVTATGQCPATPELVQFVNSLPAVVPLETPLPPPRPRDVDDMKRITAATTSAALLEFDSDPTPFRDGMLFRSEVSIALHVSRLDGYESSDVIAGMVASELAPEAEQIEGPFFCENGSWKYTIELLEPWRVGITLDTGEYRFH